MTDECKLYDFLSARGDSLIHEWADKLSKRDRIILDEKLDRLEQGGPGACPQLVGPVYKHIHKFRIKGQVVMRPMLCKGPFDMDNEYTLLFGAIEKDRCLIPEDAEKRAETNRTTLSANKKRRRAHEQFE
jgi:hypothetical protein